MHLARLLRNNATGAAQGYRHLFLNMTKRKIGDDWKSCTLTIVSGDLFKGEAKRYRLIFYFCHRSNYQGGKIRQLTTSLEMQEHSIDAIKTFVIVFYEQNPSGSNKIRCCANEIR